MEDVEQMLSASETLGWLADEAHELAPTKESVQMQAALQFARTYLLEYAKQRKSGKSRREAVAVAARGEMDITEHVENYRKSLN